MTMDEAYEMGCLTGKIDGLEKEIEVYKQIVVELKAENERLRRGGDDN